MRVDNLSPENRSRLMSSISGGKNTKPELALFEAMAGIGLRFERHARDLRGTPDAVLRRRRVAIFMDGDFWHGWKFASWEDTLPEFWREKIARTIIRDQRVRSALRREGWHVIRVWEHQVNRDPVACARRIQILAKGAKPCRA